MRTACVQHYVHTASIVQSNPRMKWSSILCSE